MNKKQIAFIICVNDDEEFAECMYYLERLYVPERYSTDIISIQNAPSMAGGYNAAMKDSDAKYKVYLHQDVFIMNRMFISDLIDIFSYDEQIGLIGMVGKRDLGTGVAQLTGWDTGSVKDNHKCWNQGCPRQEEVFQEVHAVDGLLMATQQDIRWREDIFDRWHFYDISQCMEFKRAGYKVVVPWQKEAWCYHDNRDPELTTYYEAYEMFLHEYADMEAVASSIDVNRSGYEMEKEYAQMVNTMQSGIEKLIMAGAKTELQKLFEDPDIQEYFFLKDYQTIVYIDCQEETEQSELRFWQEDMSSCQLLRKLRRLRHILKRMEFDAGEREKNRLWSSYSKYAVSAVCDRYFVDANQICGIIEPSD